MSRDRDRDRDYDRDRDPAGRPRNARPRDGLGRPLGRADSAASGVAGTSGTSGASGMERIPDDLVIGGAEAAVLADQLLRDGRPFHAHEVLEAAWKSGPAEERDLWQGLAQIAVGLTHARRGNARGAVALLRRGAERVRAAQDQAGSAGGRAGPRPRLAPQAGLALQPTAGRSASPFGMNIAAFLAASDDLAARIERDGLDGNPASRPVPRAAGGRVARWVSHGTSPVSLGTSVRGLRPYEEN